LSKIRLKEGGERVRMRQRPVSEFAAAQLPSKIVEIFRVKQVGARVKFGTGPCRMKKVTLAIRVTLWRRGKRGDEERKVIKCPTGRSRVSRFSTGQNLRWKTVLEILRRNLPKCVKPHIKSYEHAGRPKSCELTQLTHTKASNVAIWLERPHDEEKGASNVAWIIFARGNFTKSYEHPSSEKTVKKRESPSEDEQICWTRA